MIAGRIVFFFLRTEVFPKHAFMLPSSSHGSSVLVDGCVDGTLWPAGTQAKRSVAGAFCGTRWFPRRWNDGPRVRRNNGYAFTRCYHASPPFLACFMQPIFSDREAMVVVVVFVAAVRSVNLHFSERPAVETDFYSSPPDRGNAYRLD